MFNTSTFGTDCTPVTAPIVLYISDIRRGWFICHLSISKYSFNVCKQLNSTS